MSIEGHRDLAGPAGTAEDTAAREQCAALCWRPRGRGFEVLLITSRDTGRWVLPKGWPMKGRTAAQSAEREAFEEAGVIGSVDETCIGHFDYHKVLGPALSVPCRVGVYALRVTRLRDSFPERNTRNRKWFRPEKAAQKVAEPSLAELLRTFTPALPPPKPSRRDKARKTPPEA